MKILLDENIPEKLIFDFEEELAVHTTKAMGWNGKKNGELLELAIKNNFDIFVTVDRNLKYQQNLKKFPICIILLKVINNQHKTIQPLIKKIKDILKTDFKNELIEIE
jgi:predicted nuclease of predicted toxin-antitoxin system